MSMYDGFESGETFDTGLGYGNSPVQWADINWPYRRAVPLNYRPSPFMNYIGTNFSISDVPEGSPAAPWACADGTSNCCAT